MATSIDDEQLVAAHRAGDQAAFVELVRTHRPALYRHALRCLHDPAAAEDAVQEALARAYRSLHRVEGEYRLGPWLHRILANVCIDEANRRRRELEKLGRVASDRRGLELVPGVEEELGFDSAVPGVREALESLPAAYREALSLRFVDDLSYGELAERSGVSEQNARARVSRARHAMRMALRGVAALPVVALVGLRRGQRAAQAADPSPAASMAAPHAVQSSQAALGLPQVVEAANAVVASAPQTVPWLAKAAVGVGAVALAVVPAPSSRELIDPAPTTAAAATEVAAAEWSPDQPAAPPSTSAVPSPSVGATATTLAVEPASGSTTTEAPEPSAVPVVAATPAPSLAPPGPERTTLPEPEAEVPATSDPSVETPVVVPRQPGRIAVSSVEVVAAGPRLDVSGPVTLEAGDQSYPGWLSGRISIEAESLGDGSRRVDAVLTVTLDDGGLLEVLIVGRAVGADPGDGSLPATVTVSGSFQFSHLVLGGGGEVPMVTDGGFHGTLDTVSGGSMQLALGG